MMQEGWMFWGIGVGHMIALLIIALVVAALIKYAFCGNWERTGFIDGLRRFALRQSVTDSCDH